MPKDYYTVLGVYTHSTQTEIKEAYRKLCFHYHPDRNKSLAKEHCELKMQQLVEAYSVLSNPDYRREYDRMLMDKYVDQRFNESLNTPKGKWYSSLSNDRRRILILIAIVLGTHFALTILSIVIDVFADTHVVSKSLEKTRNDAITVIDTHLKID